MIRAGKGEPLVLLHGVLCSERVWNDVTPYLMSHHDVIALTALGHRGGTPGKADSTIVDIIDDIEAKLDQLGIQQAHFAGNSMGGWISIELARRGRAKSVCALSPAGFWDMGEKEKYYGAIKTIKSIIKLTENTHRLIPVLSRSRLVRRLGMKNGALYGDRLTRRQFMSMSKDLLKCTVRHSIWETLAQLDGLDPLPCPVMLAWSEHDAIFPPGLNGIRAQQLLPQADWKLLSDVGHIPMIDNPKLVAETILASTQRASF